MTTDNPEAIKVVLTQTSDYGFNVHFDGESIPDLFTDEPAPLGEGRSPNPSALLLASVANCLSASLLFALRKFKNNPGPIHTEIVAHKERNADGRWRIPRAQVTIRLSDKASSLEHLERTLAQFEQFCIVTQSVREGIAVDLKVLDADGMTIGGHG